DRLVQRRGNPSPRRRADPRHAGRGDPGGPPLLPTADAEARRRRNEPRVLLSLHGARGDRPARRRAAHGAEGVRMSDAFDDLYREVILDHYKNPRGHGVIEDADAA